MLSRSWLALVRSVIASCDHLHVAPLSPELAEKSARAPRIFGVVLKSPSAATSGGATMATAPVLDFVEPSKETI